MPDFTLAPEELSSETNDNWMNRLRNWKLLQDSLEKHLAQTDNGLQC